MAPDMDLKVFQKLELKVSLISSKERMDLALLLFTASSRWMKKKNVTVAGARGWESGIQKIVRADSQQAADRRGECPTPSFLSAALLPLRDPCKRLRALDSMRTVWSGWSRRAIGLLGCRPAGNLVSGDLVSGNGFRSQRHGAACQRRAAARRRGPALVESPSTCARPHALRVSAPSCAHDR